MTFQGRPSDDACARDHLIRALAKLGCAVDADLAAAPHAVSLRLPTGGSAILAVGRAHKSGMADACGLVASLTVTNLGSGVPEDVTALLQVLDRLPLTDWEITRVAEQMPITRTLADHLGPDVFAGLSLLCAIHHMRDFTAMLSALIPCGADPALTTIIDKGYPYRLRDRVDGWLRHRLGVTIVDYPQRADGIAAHLDRAAAAGARTLVFDDGGYVLPVVLDTYPQRASEIVGVVEQTMSGVWKLQCYPQLPVPVFSVAESALEAAVEAPHVAAAALNSVIERLPDETWAGRPALVLGYGRLGRQAARLLRDVHRMRVAVHDREPAVLVTAQVDGFAVGRDLSTLISAHRPLLIIGGAGRGGLTGEHAEAFASSAYLASMTSRDYEFPLADWAKRAERVIDYGTLGHGYHLPRGVELCVIGDGLPVNFHHRESVPNRVIDVVFAALLLGGATLAQPDQGGHGPGRDVALVDQVLADSPALDTYLELYADDAAERRLLTPPAGHCPDYTRSPWRYSTP
ncbi:MAG: hypothetical protein ACRDYA_17970 [Egibacteraceae bacterium]